MPRLRLPSNTEDQTESIEGGMYFEPPSVVRKFTSGSTLLDCILGGGWPEGRMVNIVGDSGSGKSLLSMEAVANFLNKYPDGEVFYIETEEAFDPAYADSLGIPVSSITLERDIYLVEDLFKYLQDKIEGAKGGNKLLIVDSLDAISDKAESDRDITDASYGTSKARILSQMFRRIHAKMGRNNITLFIVSQVRENIGVTFGEKLTRAGGKSLRFYSTVELWLAHIGRKKRTTKGVERVVGVDIKAITKKNRLAPPFREVQFPIIFNYGVDDVGSCINWLDKVNRVADVAEKNDRELMKDLARLEGKELSDLETKIKMVTKKVWDEIEYEFQPKKKKYSGV